MPKAKAALLDVDGTLVDSNEAHARAWVRALADLGHEVAYERVRTLIGKGGDKLLPETIGVDSDSREGKKIAARRSALFKAEYLPKLKAFAGAPKTRSPIRTSSPRPFARRNAIRSRRS